MTANRDRSWTRTLLTCSLLALTPALGRGQQRNSALHADIRSECQRLLDEGAVAQAQERIAVALEHDPEAPELLDTAARVYARAGDVDRAVVFAVRTLESARDDGRFARERRSAEQLLAGFELPVPVPQAVLELHRTELVRLAKLCYGERLYVNAVDLADRGRGGRLDESAEDLIEKVRSRRDSVGCAHGLGDRRSGELAVGKSSEWIEREDARHREWEDAYEVKSDNYTVVTNMGYELAHTMSASLEHMNRFYRDVFDYRQQGGSMRRCTIEVYDSRALFDREAGLEGHTTTRGFFDPQDNRVVTYDPLTDGLDRNFLLVTLFHEASHQFTRAISSNPIPAWLNEGTASYFEGARLLPSGSVRTNLVPSHRLTELVQRLNRSEPTLEQVVSFFDGGSYPGEYYPYGWGLVYFLLNYEDERSERIYVPLYEEYSRTYKSGEKHDPFERFVEYFVERAEQPGIASFDEFERAWRPWILELNRLENGGAAVSGEYLRRARVQRGHGKLEAALESLERAVDGCADDAEIFLERGSVLHELGREDAALLEYRRALEALEARSGDPSTAESERDDAEKLAAVWRRIGEVDRGFAANYAELRAALSADVLRAAKAYADSGCPHTALLLLDRATELLGAQGAILRLAASIRAHPSFLSGS